MICFCCVNSTKALCLSQQPIRIWVQTILCWAAASSILTRQVSPELCYDSKILTTGQSPRTGNEASCSSNPRFHLDYTKLLHLSSTCMEARTARVSYRLSASQLSSVACSSLSTVEASCLCSVQLGMFLSFKSSIHPDPFQVCQQLGTRCSTSTAGHCRTGHISYICCCLCLWPLVMYV